jgi:hypothetical protein
MEPIGVAAILRQRNANARSRKAASEDTLKTQSRLGIGQTVGQNLAAIDQNKYHKSNKASTQGGLQRNTLPGPCASGQLLQNI